MRVVAIVQARMGSKRLPGKVLMDLEGESVLSRVIQRLRRSSRVDEIVVATTHRFADDAVVEECARLECAVVRGSSDDVLDRYVEAAQAYSADAVVRITADCPLLDAALVDETILQFVDRAADYASNSLEATFPRGLDTEVVTAKSLSRAWREALQPYQREHVTPYIYEHPEIFRIVSVTADSDFSVHRWTLDTLEDLALVRAVYARFRSREDFGWREVIGLFDREPDLMQLNAGVPQKTPQRS